MVFDESPKQGKICLKKEILEHGFHLQVGYLSEVVITETEG
jgi:hypothetical protein